MTSQGRDADRVWANLEAAPTYLKVRESSHHVAA